MHYLKKGQKIRAWVDPPPHSGNARKKTFFFNGSLPLGFLDNGLHQVVYQITYLHVYLPTVVDIDLFKRIPENEARFQKLVFQVQDLRSSSLMSAPSSSSAPLPISLNNYFLFTGGVVFN